MNSFVFFLSTCFRCGPRYSSWCEERKMCVDSRWFAFLLFFWLHLYQCKHITKWENEISTKNKKIHDSYCERIERLFYSSSWDVVSFFYCCLRFNCIFSRWHSHNAFFSFSVVFLKKNMIISVTLLDIWRRHGASFLVAELSCMNEMRLNFENKPFVSKNEKQSVKKGKYTSSVLNAMVREPEMKSQRETYCWHISHIWKYMPVSWLMDNCFPPWIFRFYNFSIHFSIFFTEILAEIPLLGFWTTFSLFQLLNRALCTNLKANTFDSSYRNTLPK